MRNDLKILIVEDEALIAEMISEILEDAGYSNISVASSFNEAISLLKSRTPELVLSDINLENEKSGLDLGSLLHSTYKIPFIYITSHSTEGVIEKAKHTRPNGFIIKPFKAEDILVAIELALFNSNDGGKALPAEINLKVGRSIVRLSWEDIMWIESESNYSSIYLSEQMRKVARISLSEIHEQLPSDIFYRIHKSYVINKTYIDEIKTNSVLIGSNELPIGRAYQSVVSKLLA